MGHGTHLEEKEYFITAKGNVFPVEEKLREIFGSKNNLALQGKPKIFVPSMFRGSKLELLGVSLKISLKYIITSNYFSLSDFFLIVGSFTKL